MFNIRNFFHCVYGSLIQLPRAFLTNGQSFEDEWSTRAEDWELSNRWLHWGPITATIVIVIVGMTTSLVHVSWWPINTFGGFFDLMVFLTWNYLVLTTLNHASTLTGGYIKLGWHPEEGKHWKILKYCHRCMCYKVPRSHHCSRCNRCVVLMDHHCPWINTCVGRRNQFHFIRFLFFSVVGGIHAAVVLTSCLYEVVTILMHVSTTENQWHYYEPPNMPITSITLFIFAVLSIGLAYGVVIAVGILLGIQLYGVYLDVTGIESLVVRGNVNSTGHQHHSRHVTTMTNGNGVIRKRHLERRTESE